MEQLGRSTPLYATPMAYELIKLKQADMGAALPNIREGMRAAKETLGPAYQRAEAIVHAMRTLDTDQCEIVATLYAVHFTCPICLSPHWCGVRDT